MKLGFQVFTKENRACPLYMPNTKREYRRYQPNHEEKTIIYL